jgi:hypothetical protein
MTYPALPRSDLPLNSLRLEVVEGLGDGFRTWFGPNEATDAVLKVAGAVLRLRGVVP